jgi:hypothetical protein
MLLNLNTTPALSREIESLSAGGSVVTWDASSFFTPKGCSSYSLNVIHRDIYWAFVEVLNFAGRPISSATPTASGAFELEICERDFQGPFTLSLTSVVDEGSFSAEVPLVFQERDGEPAPNPVPYLDVFVTEITPSKASSGDIVTLIGQNIDKILTVSIDWVAAEVVFQGPSQLRFRVPLGLTFGNKSISLTFDAPGATILGGLDVIERHEDGSNVEDPSGGTDSESSPDDPLARLKSHGPADGAFSAWTKVLAGGNQMKFYAKYLQPGQKVQFMLQNPKGVYEQVAWKRVGLADLGPQGEYTNLQNHVYFIRTIDLKPGKNRVRIVVDGKVIWGTKTYSR